MDTSANQPRQRCRRIGSQVLLHVVGRTVSVYVRHRHQCGIAQSLTFATGTDGGGKYVTFTMPSLDYWDMAWVNY